MAAEVWETPFPEQVWEAAGKIAADAQQGRLAAASVHTAIGGGGTAMERRARIVQLAEEAIGRTARDLTVAKSALGGGATGQEDHARLRAGDTYDATERCCDRLVLIDLLLDPPPRLSVVPSEDEEGSVRVRVADALEKAMGLAEDCASRVRRARLDASGTPAT